MGLNGLDFLSNAPKNFIFRNTSNKTNFGGVLFLLYIFIVILIALFYLTYFFIEEDYSVEYTHNLEVTSEDKDELKLKDDRYNPYFDFEFLFYYEKNGKKIRWPNGFALINLTNEQPIPFGVKLKLKVSDIKIAVAMNIDYNKSIPHNFIVDVYHHDITSPLYQSKGDKDWIPNRWIFTYDKPSANIGFFN